MSLHPAISPQIDPGKLDKLAAVAVHVGLGLQPGQDLLITAPIAAAELVRRITAEAYKAGAGLVTCLYNDDQLALLRYKHGADASFDRAAGWLFEGMAKAYTSNTARLAVSGENPFLLNGQDPAKVSRANKAASIASKPAMEPIVTFATNWTIVSYPTLPWAKAMFPDDADDVALGKLADAIFKASRIENDDPVAAWNSHNDNLHKRADWMNAKRFHALRFYGPGTDLTVGLADEHEWEGGSAKTQQGITCNANIPTEEIFTTPHSKRVSGYASSTKPLSHAGTLIDGIWVRFEDGKIVESRAEVGGEVLKNILATDEGASRIGEVALVPHSSPISQSGLLFFNTLYDENASCHIALGQCYAKCFVNGTSLSQEEIEQRGGNQSLIHIDWMIGSDEIDVDGIYADGTTEAVFRKGEWAF